VDFLFGLGATLFVIACLYTAYPAFTVFVGVCAVAYFIYNIVLGSKWLANWESTSKSNAVKRQEQRKIDEIAKDWETTDWHLPTAEEFTADVSKHINTTLPPIVEASILGSQQYFYGRSGILDKKLSVKHTKRLHGILLDSCVRGINRLSVYFPRTETTHSPFWIKRPINPDTIAPIYQHLAELFDTEELTKHLFQGCRFTLPEPPNNPGTLKERYEAYLYGDDEDVPRAGSGNLNRAISGISA
jgi:hypothetical protein